MKLLKVFIPILKLLLPQLKEAVKHPLWKSYVGSRVDDLIKVISIYGDDIPDNAAQLKRLVEDNKEKFIDDHLLKSAEIILTSKKLDENTRRFLSEMLVSIAAIQMFRDPKERAAFEKKERFRLARLPKPEKSKRGRKSKGVVNIPQEPKG